MLHATIFLIDWIYSTCKVSFLYEGFFKNTYSAYYRMVDRQRFTPNGNIMRAAHFINLVVKPVTSEIAALGSPAHWATSATIEDFSF